MTTIVISGSLNALNKNTHLQNSIMDTNYNAHKKSGLLLAISSLPGNFGIGEIGKHARGFIDTLTKFKQSSWQFLPIGPTGYGNSPYQSFSSFAGNELLISFDDLIEQGLITIDQAQLAQTQHSSSIDYGQVITSRNAVLTLASESFMQNANPSTLAKFDQFCSQYAYWLHDYALFRVIKDNHQQRPWYQWPSLLRDRNTDELTRLEREYKEQILHYKVAQFLFSEQWFKLRQKAKTNEIELIGDIPIFIAHDSADVWCNRELFLLDKQGNCTVVAGVPPDYFSETGQRWGNPLYDWQQHQETGFAWWFKRLDYALSMVDVLRIDHFRGFEAYWQIPADEKTAINGQWIKAPGRELFKCYLAHQPDAQFIAEDLGVITTEVEQLRDEFALPTMRVLQFAFDWTDDNIHLPQNYPQNCVAYTSTHDNNTLRGWFNSLEDKSMIERVVDIHSFEQATFKLIKLVMQSTASRVIFPMQDVLDLDAHTRMNTPSKFENNWQWRVSQSQLNSEKLTVFAQLTQSNARDNPKFKLDNSKNE